MPKRKKVIGTYRRNPDDEDYATGKWEEYEKIKDTHQSGDTSTDDEFLLRRCFKDDEEN